MTGSPIAFEAEEIVRRYQAAKAIHTRWHPLWQECHDFALPARDRFDGSQVDGQKQTDNMFDMTAAVSLQEFASRLQAGLTPTFARWSKLKPGQQIKKKLNPAAVEQVEKALDDITEEVFAAFHRSNFDSQIHESFLDLGIGTGSLICDADTTDLITFTAVPLTECCLEPGPDGSISGRFRFRHMTAVEITRQWPGAQLPEAMRMNGGILAAATTRYEVVAATLRDWGSRDTERYVHRVISVTHKAVMFGADYQGQGSCPWINFRWSKAAGEVYGRGPLILALPDIKVVNVTVQMLLENAELALAGIWQGEDDGILNPATIRLAPGTVFPIAPGSSGLKSLEMPGRFDVAQLILGDLRSNIKRALYDEALGPPTGTPMSATEVSTRMADLYRRMGSAYGRLQRELVQPLIRRVIYLLRKSGRIQLPDISGEALSIISVSPLSSAQAQEQVQKFQMYSGIMAQTFGPDRLPLVINPGEASAWLAEQFEMPKRILYTGDQQNQLLQQMQAAAAAGGASGGGGGGMMQ